jgi:hypothetical protein
LKKKPPTRDEFTAYGQACLEMARGIFQALRVYEARLFAAVIPASVVKPATFEAEEYLRKDHVFLLERFFYFLEAEKQHGVLVFDQVDKGSDQRFVRRMERYFSRTNTGRYRSSWIVPVPMTSMPTSWPMYRLTSPPSPMIRCRYGNSSVPRRGFRIVGDLNIRL